ncbi:Regulatory protein rop [Xenorhabdus bovienii str. puntauvense]|uniref:Regulatory protein rop n=2 Tax=Xenorhabdus bovienii TaxID=40576 RepID=A0A077NG68_XENBV|nr:Regulatory protein rop [Xenorhabdus bovienii str. puntauvense]
MCVVWGLKEKIMNKQEKSCLNIAKFIRGQTLLLLEKINELDLDDEAEACEKLHDDAEALYHQLVSRYGEE